MSLAQSPCLSMGSTDRPMIFTPRRSNSGLIEAMYPSSVVQTGVKSFGCENSTAHESPIQSWKRILPSVVSASKSGAVSPIWSAIRSSLFGPFSSASPDGTSVAVDGEVHVVLRRAGPVAAPAPADRPEGLHDGGRDHPLSEPRPVEV